MQRAKHPLLFFNFDLLRCENNFPLQDANSACCLCFQLKKLLNFNPTFALFIYMFSKKTFAMECGYEFVCWCCDALCLVGCDFRFRVFIYIKKNFEANFCTKIIIWDAGCFLLGCRWRRHTAVESVHCKRRHTGAVSFNNFVSIDFWWKLYSDRDICWKSLLPLFPDIALKFYYDYMFVIAPNLLLKKVLRINV